MLQEGSAGEALQSSEQQQNICSLYKKQLAISSNLRSSTVLLVLLQYHSYFTVFPNKILQAYLISLETI
jgi:hypothetical protein